MTKQISERSIDLIMCGFLWVGFISLVGIGFWEIKIGVQNGVWWGAFFFGLLMFSIPISFLADFHEKRTIVRLPISSSFEFIVPDSSSDPAINKMVRDAQKLLACLRDPLQFEVMRLNLAKQQPKSERWEMTPYSRNRFRISKEWWRGTENVIWPTSNAGGSLAKEARSLSARFILQITYGNDSTENGVLAASRKTWIDTLFFLGPQYIVMFPSGLIIITHKKGIVAQ